MALQYLTLLAMITRASSIVNILITYYILNIDRSVTHN